MTEHDRTSPANRLGPPPVEPLSDAAWSRVERGLWARMDDAPARAREAAPPRRWGWGWIAAPALAAAAAVIAVVATGAGGHGEGEAAPARLVSHEGPTSLSLAGVHVTLDAHSAVVMDRERNAVLEHGGATFSIAPRGARSPFVVRAGDAVVRVIGTRFHVARYGEVAKVIVEHGTVEVVFRGATKRLGGGQQWTSQEPAAVTPVRMAERTAPGAVAVAVDPAAVEPPAAEEQAPAAEPAPTAAATAPAPGAEPGRAPRASSAEPAARAPVTAASPAADRDQQRFRRLEALEAQHPRAAIDGYLQLSRGDSRWAERALFAAARLAADRKEPRAKLLLEIYLQRFPRGANAADARTLIDHIQGDHQ